MLAVAPYVTVDVANRIARSMLAFTGSFGREGETLAHAAEHPELYHAPGPTRPSSITACVPAFVQVRRPGNSAICWGDLSLGTLGRVCSDHVPLS